MVVNLLISFAVSAVTTFLITAKVKKDVMNYVNDVCEINIEQVNAIKTLSLSTVDELVKTINQNKPE